MVGVRMRRRMQPAIALAGSSGHGNDISIPLATLSADNTSERVLAKDMHADINSSFAHWDPLGLGEGALKAHVKSFRESEMQHGQVATIAVFFVSAAAAKDAKWGDAPPHLTAARRTSVVLHGLFGGDGEKAITYDDVKKFGVSGTIAYVLTELAFWAVAFPVASALFTQANGHAPDLFNSGEDRAAVVASIFVGANVARLAVPLRFGVALAAAPWVDENIVRRFGGDSVDVEVVEEEPVVEEEQGFSLPKFKNP